MKIQKIKITEINPAKYNPRFISEPALEALRKSIQKFGLVEPLIINKNMTLISGHQRLKALILENKTEAYCLVVDLNKTEEKALNVQMNNPKTQGIFDYQQLNELLDEIKLDFDLFEDLNFNELFVDSDFNPEDEWEGMPECNNEDLTSFKKIIVHFKSKKEMQEFSLLLKQTITEKTQSLWYPAAKITRYSDKRYQDES